MSTDSMNDLFDTLSIQAFQWPLLIFYFSLIYLHLMLKDAFWPDIYAGRNPVLWAHEWTKHGTCIMNAGIVATVEEYFQLTVGFFQSVDVMVVLSSSLPPLCPSSLLV